MLHFFKENGKRYVYDSGSGEISPVSALEQKMLSYLKLPLSPDMPTSLRYDLAKYDGGAVEDAYENIYALYKAGKLFSDDGAEDADETAESKRDTAIEAFRLRLKEREI